MPPLHRWLGNPVLTGLGRLFFRTPTSRTSTAACAASAATRSRGSTSGRPGMEYASEMVVKAALFGLDDPRDPRDAPQGRPVAPAAPPHVARRLAPPALPPPLLAALALPRARPRSSSLVGAALILWLLPGPRVAFGATLGRPLDPRRRRDGPRRRAGRLLRRLREDLRHHRGPPPEGPASRVASSTGGSRSRRASPPRASRSSPARASWATSSSAWSAAGFHDLAYGATMRWMIPGVLFLVLGAEGVFGSFLLSLLGVRRR